MNSPVAETGRETRVHYARNGFLTAKGLEETAQREREFAFVFDVGLTRGAGCVRLDKSGSVSGSLPPESIFEDQVIEEQDRRFHHGS